MLTGVGVEKVLQQNVFHLGVDPFGVLLLSVRLGGGWQNLGCRSAEEPHQSFDVLRSRR